MITTTSCDHNAAAVRVVVTCTLSAMVEQVQALLGSLCSLRVATITAVNVRAVAAVTAALLFDWSACCAETDEAGLLKHDSPRQQTLLRYNPTSSTTVLPFNC